MTVIKPEMITREITRHDVLPLSFLKKTAYTGSKRGIRYKMAKTEIEPGADNDADKVENAGTGEDSSDKAEPAKRTVLRCYVWNGQFSYDNTPKEEIRGRDFEFDDSGIDAAIAYLNEELKAADELNGT